MTDEAQVTETTENTPPAPPDIKNLLNQITSKPDKETLDAWKAEHGEIFVFAASETEMFIFHPISRPLWTKLNRLVAENPEVDQEVETIKAVTLWKSLSDSEMEKKAGLFASYANTIMEHSAFMPPQVASILTVKL